MTRLLVHVEGRTEEEFVHEVLKDHLYQHGYSHVAPRIMGQPNRRDQRGGIRGWLETKRDMIDHLREDQDRINTTMVDYYGLPQSGANAWPGRAAADRVILADRATTVEKAIQKDLRRELGDSLLPHRFLPYVMMHEFEAMLFSDCTLFAQGIGRPELEPEFQAIVEKFGGPEGIDDTPEGAPSKRIERLVDDYEKPLMGVLAALEIGLGGIRAACPHFNAWLARLEEIPATA